ncbi:MAG: hypothetical protein WC548_00470 [Candidatus Pacearchaeota archaeon]
MEKDLGRIKKNPETEILVRIDDFGGKPGLTIREFVTSEKYTGFTKSGTRIPVESFEAFKKMINSVKPGDFGNAGEVKQEKLPVKKILQKKEDLDLDEEFDDSGIDDEGLI